MRATPVITGAVLLALTLGACKSDDKVAPADSQLPTQPSSTAPSTPSGLPSTPPPTTGTAQGAVRVPDNQVDMSGLPEYYRERKVWILNGGRTLQVSAMARDACTGVTAKVVEQNDNLVHIVIAPMDVPQGGNPDGPPICAQVLTPRIVTVDLKVPLGTRKVIVTTEGP